MLDDLKLIHQRDVQDMLGAAEKQWRQLEYEFELPASFAPDHVYSVVCAGVGDSILGADIARTWLDVKVPLEVVRSYDLPAYVNGDTLFVVCDYSGDTEEALSTLAQAETKGTVVVVVSAGGKLADIALAKGYPLLRLPATSQPGSATFATWYMVKAILTVLEHYKLTGITGTANQAGARSNNQELASQAGWFAEQLATWRPDVPASKNVAKQIALELLGKSVVVYAGPRFLPAAYHWKTNINQYAKQIAWCGQYPEFNHNEVAGWSKQPVQKPYAVVEIHNNQEHPRVLESFAASQRLLSGLRPSPIVVEPVGDTLLQQLLFSTALGDFVSVYLALLSGVNPASQELIDKVKKGVGVSDDGDLKNKGDQEVSQKQDQPPVFDPAGFSTEPYVKRVEKPWGYEFHWVPAGLPYMGKVLHINAGECLSLQVHDTKQESYFLIAGQALIYWENNQGQMITTELKNGVGYRTAVGQKHRLIGVTDCDIIEASSPEAGTTWRLEDKYARPNETPEQRKKERGE